MSGKSICHVFHFHQGDDCNAHTILEACSTAPLGGARPGGWCSLSLLFCVPKCIRLLLFAGNLPQGGSELDLTSPDTVAAGTCLSAV